MTADQIAAMDRDTVNEFLHAALCRLAFLRSTDAEWELSRLVKPFSHDDYQRCAVPLPKDHEVGS